MQFYCMPMAVMCFVCLMTVRAADDQTKTLFVENPEIKLEMGQENGVFLGVMDTVGKAAITSVTGEAGNFRLVVRKDDGKLVTIQGKDQLLASSEKIRDGTVLCWKSPLKAADGELFEINVSMKVLLTGRKIEFSLDLENKTEFKVAEVQYPILSGGIGSILDESKSSWLLNYPDPYLNKLPDAAMPADYTGNYPYWMGMPWIDISSPEMNAGLFFANLDPLSRHKTIRVEKPTVPGGSRSFGTMYWVHYPYCKPKAKFAGPPVVLQFHQGDWRTSCELYREWFIKQFGIADPAKHWLRQLPAYQDVMFLLPEGNVNMRFADMPQWARDGLKYGIKAVLVSGWQVGGHDGWYPYYTPDPRLGTWDDLKAAIQECHKMGVKVFFFVNYQPVDNNTEWYQKELKRYQLMDINGNFGAGGFGMGTVAGRLRWTERKLTNVSPGFPEYRQIITRQMVELTKVGADGLHFDKFHIPGLNFNPDLPVGPDFAETTELMRGLEEVVKACRKVNPDIVFSFETYWDRAMQYSAGVTWHWGPMQDCFHMTKFVFPEWTNCLSINQPYDYAVVNNCVMYGYQMLVGPRNYTASIGDPAYAQIGAYIKDAIEVVENLKETVFLGRYLNHDGVVLEQADVIRYAVHQNMKTGKRAVVIVNPTMESKEAVLKGFADSVNIDATLYRPGLTPSRIGLPMVIMIPGERFVIVEEK